jgi:hypothetical protein
MWQMFVGQAWQGFEAMMIDICYWVVIAQSDTYNAPSVAVNG